MSVLVRPTLSKTQLQGLSKPDNLRSGIYYGSIFVGIGLCFLAASQAPHIALWIPLMVIIAGLQHHILIIHHESIHYLLFSRRSINEFFGTLAAFTVGFTMAYRKQHFAHHKNLGKPNDPDLPNYNLFPITSRYLLVTFAKNISGFAAVSQFLGQQLKPVRAKPKTKHTSNKSKPFDYGFLGMAAVQLGFFGILLYTGNAVLYLLLWLLPLVTLTKTLTNTRNLAEHLLRQRHRISDVSRHRVIYCGPVEQFFFAPMFFNYHADHHIYPVVTYGNLPKLHDLLRTKPGYKQYVDIQRGFIKFILKSAVSTTAHFPENK